MAAEATVDLADAVADVLTARTTAALPEQWRGDYSAARARAWISERDAESTSLLVMEKDTGRPVGIVVLADIPFDDGSLDLRIGFVLAELAWGRGLATELVSGLCDRARSRPGIRSLTGGVEPGNRASARVLEKNGFRPIGTGGDGSVTYRWELTD